MSNQSPTASGKDQFPEPPMERNRPDGDAMPNAAADDHGVHVDNEDDGLNEEAGDETRE